MSAALLGLIAALCWGVHDVIAAGASRAVGALLLAAAVTLLGLTVLTLVLLVMHELPPLGQDRLWLPLLAGAGIALATLGLFESMRTGPVSVALPVVMSYPATSLLLGSLAGRPPSILQLAMAALVLAGVIVVAVTEPDSPTKDGKSGFASLRRCLTAGVLAHFTFAVSNFAGQYAATLFGTLPATWFARLGGGAVMLLALLGFARTVPWRASARWLPALALLGTLDIVAVGLVNEAGHTANPELAIVAAASAAPITILLAWLFLKEHIAPLRWIGIMLTFAGVAALSAIT